jgi:pimeloyl-ACP methyl ester carboxylesterase
MVDPPLKIDESMQKRLASRIKGLLIDRYGTTASFARGMYKQPQTESYLNKVTNASLVTPTNSAVTLLTFCFIYNDSDWIQILKTADKPILFIGSDGKENGYIEMNKAVKIDYVIIAGSGHAIFVDKPVEFNKIVENFISKK